jgi:UDP-GlcNAc:undecaprenyl-phosphate GlcNAc-1-phosphate transferase
MTDPVSVAIALIVFLSVLACVCSYAFTGGVCWIIPRLHRAGGTEAQVRSGSTIPRFGGLAVALAVAVSGLAGSALLHFILPATVVDTSRWLPVLDGFFVIFLGAVLDDARCLPPWAKFVFQAAGATVTIWLGIRIDEVSLFGGASYHLGALALPLTYLWIVGLTNAYNLVDGLDGLAAGLGAIAAGTSVVLFLMRDSYSDAALLAILFGALVGFLPHNFNPARIYLGDAGSQLIGFVMAVTAVQGSQKQQTALAVVIPLLVFGIPILDTMIQMIRRFSGGLHRSGAMSLVARYRMAARLMFVGDKEHIHHRLLALGLPHRHTVLALYAVGLLLSTLAMISVMAQYRNAGLILATVGFATAIGISKLGYSDVGVVRIGWVLRWFDQMKIDRTFFFGFFDLFLIGCAYWGAYYLIYGFRSSFGVYQWHLNMFPVVMVVQFAVFYAVGLYRGVWRAIGARDLLRVGVGVCLGGVLSYSIVVISEPPAGTGAVFALDILGLGWLMGGVRSAYRLVGFYRPRTRSAQSALIYGAGFGGELVLRELQQNTLRGLHPVGFIDDDVDYRDRVINGVPVLGSSQELPTILDRLHVQVLVISSNKIGGLALRRVLHVCRTKGVIALRSEFQFRPVSLEQVTGVEGARAATGTFGRAQWPSARRVSEPESSLTKAVE